MEINKGVIVNKKIIHSKVSAVILFTVVVFCITASLNAEKGSSVSSVAGIEKTVQELMKKGDIPGLSLVILRPGQADVIKGFGYADLEKKIPVTPDTLFELGSCSKSFTALAALQLESQGLLNLDNRVSGYLPWFYVTYKKMKVGITLRQLLHHTGGIPFNSIQRIPLGDEPDALEQAVRNIVGMELANFPGTQYQYATINYDIIGLIIEKVTGMSYEDYMETHVFKPLGLSDTVVGTDREELVATGKMAAGYKISFWTPRRYHAPPYRGNQPSGYIVSNAKDMARWLKLQMGLVESPFSPMMQKSQQVDKTVPSDRYDNSSYTMGWQVSLSGDGEIRHGGSNPNYTAYVAFRPQHKVGVVVLANSNSNYTNFIGKTVMGQLYGTPVNEAIEPGNGFDNTTSVLSIILFVVLGIIGAYIFYIVIELLMGRRSFERFGWLKLGKIVGVISLAVPFLYGIYLIPIVILNLPLNFSRLWDPWDFAWVWIPGSFNTAIMMLLACSAIGYLAYILSAIFPRRKEYVKSLPMLIIFGMLSSGALAALLYLVVGKLFSSIKLIYLLYYFGLMVILYILGLKIVQKKSVKMISDTVYNMRRKLVECAFNTLARELETSERSKEFALLNDDISQVEDSSNLLINLPTSIIKVTAVMFYFSLVDFWAIPAALGGIIILSDLYHILTQKAQDYLGQAKKMRNDYIRLFNGFFTGFKELSAHVDKMKEYKENVEKYADESLHKTMSANSKFFNAFVICELIFSAVLVVVAFGIPWLFPRMQIFTLLILMMALFYLLGGPIHSILFTLPQVKQLRSTWKRVKKITGDNR